jgi:thioredoxin 1
MKGILEEFHQTHSESIDIRFVDLWELPEEAEKYSVRVVPTLIFLDSQQNELYRHEGVMTREMLLNKWKELGYELMANGDDNS